MAVVVVAINPSEIFKKTRDTKRINDLSNLHELIQLANSEGLLNSTICNGTNIYISLPSSIDLSNINNLPSGFSWVQVSEADLRKSDSTGWIPINVSDISGFSMPTLPVDPQNTLNDNLYYTFYCNPQQEYILTSYMESKTFGPKGNETSKTNKDGGPDPYLYELGSNLFISPLKPVGSWSFDEGAGTIANDSSGNNNNGIIYGNPTWATNGQVNKALSFDGTDDYVDCGNDESLNITDKITIEAWIKNSDSGNEKITVGKGWYNDPAGKSWWLLKNFDNRLNFGAIIDNHEAYFSTNIDTSGTIWYHVVGTYDGSNLRIYVNNIEGNSYAQTGSLPTNGAPVKIGSGYYSGNAYFFKGIIDEVRIYNRSLSAEEIKRHYEMSK